MPLLFFVFFFFNDPATPEIYTLPLHDALPISAASTRSAARPPPPRSSASPRTRPCSWPSRPSRASPAATASRTSRPPRRSEEHTSELQSRQYLVCRLLLEKKKIKKLQLQPAHS